jgi:hypothetical protein
MKKQTDPRSPFLWQGKPSIFTTGNWKDTHAFDGTNSIRSANQSRIEPRPMYLTSDSVYLKAPKLSRVIR